MKKVTVFGVGSIGARIAFFLARNSEVARIRLVDIDPGRSRATLLDFLQSNVALRSKIEFSDYEEPKEIALSDVVIIAAGVQTRIGAGVSMPADADLRTMEAIAAQVGHFAPQAIVAVLSQPAEIFCSVIAKSGYFAPERVVGFPLLIYREWFRNHLSRLVGLSNEDVRITTVRTLDGEELVVSQTAISGVPLSTLVNDATALALEPTADVIGKRLQYHHYAPAAVISEVTGELVSKRRQIITAICFHRDINAYVEAKAIIGPNGVERILPLELSDEQRSKHAAYRDRVVALTSKLA